MNVEDICHEVLALMVLPIWLALCDFESRGWMKTPMWPEVDTFYRSWNYP